VSIVLQSDSLSYILPTRKYRYYKPTQAKGLNKKNEPNKNRSYPNNSAFYLNLPKDEINMASNDYKLSILVKEGNKLLAIKHIDQIVSKE